MRYLLQNDKHWLNGCCPPVSTARTGGNAFTPCWLIGLMLCLLMLPVTQAQVTSLVISPDITAAMPRDVGGAIIAFDTVLFDVDPSTGLATGGTVPLAGPPFIAVDVDAYDGLLDAFSVDIASEVEPAVSGSTFFMRPGEIYTRSGTMLFDPVAAGLPANTNVDALSVDPATGDLVFSVAETIASPLILPSDLYRWDGSNLSLFFNGFRVPRALNLDAAHVLDDNTILMSFDTAGSIDTVRFLDDELLLYNPSSDAFFLNTITTLFASDWFPADLDALYVVEGPTGFTIGGSVSGLAGSGLVLRNNGVDDLPISGNGSFTFATPVPDGGSYNVTVATQPSGPAQNCTVSNGSGTVSGSNVTNVQVSCVTGGQVQFATAVAEVMEDSGPVSLTINRVGGSDGATSFRVQTASGSATSGSDFNAVNQLLNWGAGDSSSRTVNITINNDPTVEAFSEDFVVTLSRESGSATLGAPAQVTVTIYDNESVIFADGFEGEP